MAACERRSKARCEERKAREAARQALAAELGDQPHLRHGVRDHGPEFEPLARTLAVEGETPAEKIRAGFRRVLARVPAESETRPLVTLYQESRKTYAAAPERAIALIKNAENSQPANVPPAELAAWTTVANVLLNLDETLMKR